MRSTIPLLCLLLAVSCVGDSRVNLDELGGYWQIEKVSFPNGQEREFVMNPMVDYIQIKGDTGIRKKVVPQLDGSFKINQSAEQFIALWEGDSLRLQYRTPYDQWTETVLRTGDSILVVVNREGRIYHYKKFRNFSFE